MGKSAARSHLPSASASATLLRARYRFAANGCAPGVHSFRLPGFTPNPAITILMEFCVNRTNRGSISDAFFTAAIASTLNTSNQNHNHCASTPHGRWEPQNIHSRPSFRSARRNLLLAIADASSTHIFRSPQHRLHGVAEERICCCLRSCVTTLLVLVLSFTSARRISLPCSARQPSPKQYNRTATAPSC